MPGHTCKRFLFIFLLLLLPGQVRADHCTIAQIAIIAGPWENTSTKTSLTLQAQDSGGVSCHASQTLRVSLESSASGSFSGQTGNALQFYISTSNANRNFYYDGHPASYILTAKAGYGAADSWGVLFTTTYNGSGSSSGATTTEETTSNSSSSSGRSSTNTVTVFTYYVSTPLSDIDKEAAFKVGAGQDRLGSVGSPLEFKAETEVEYTKNNIFKWNFGDGSEGIGKVLSHTYEYPGEYVVMLNTSSPEGPSVSRVNVKIIEPEIIITLAMPERIELKNNSKFEVSLFGRALIGNGKAFVFPQDTIIKAGQSISFSSRVTGLQPKGIGEALIMVIGNTEQPQIWKKIEEQKAEKIASIQARLSELKQQLANIYPTNVAATPNLAVQPPSEPETEKSASTSDAIEPQTASASGGWLQTLKRFFLRTK